LLLFQRIDVYAVSTPDFSIATGKNGFDPKELRIPGEGLTEGSLLFAAALGCRMRSSPGSNAA
jgi:hypothetical protein